MEDKKTTEAEAKSQIDAIKAFLQIAKNLLINVDLPVLKQEISRFDSFAPLLDPSAWLSGRDANRDLAEWIEVIEPLKNKLDKLNTSTT